MKHSLFFLACVLATPGFAEPSLVRFDFENGDPQGWGVVAGEFAQPVCKYAAAAAGNLPNSGEGAYYLTTSGAAMGQTGADTERMGGVIESPVFVLEGEEITFLFGGVAAKVTLHTIDGRQQRVASLWAPGRLKQVRWNVSKLVGEQVFVRLVDGPENGRGFACLDAFEAAGRLDPEATDILMLADVYQGRNMDGVERGEVKQLLVLETLPKAVNFSGRADPYSFDHSFNLNRVLGTVPVEPDGSACLEVPAMRGIILAALDENGLAVKRMQSFLTVQPGETIGCVGCHEPRTQPPSASFASLQAMVRPPSKIEPFDDVPDVFDFPRDIQPILERHCVACHDYDASDRGGPRAGRAILSGDHGPVFSHSFATLHMFDQVVVSRDGMGNKPPRGFGSGASPLMKLIDGSHYGAALSSRERRAIRLWLDASATYAGTCAASGTGKFPDKPRLASGPAAAGVLQRRCNFCHTGQRRLPQHPGDTVGVKGYAIVADRLPRRMSNHLIFNLTRPEKSLILLAPLSKASGGYGICHQSGRAVFADTADAGYRTLLRLVRECKSVHDEDRRFDMPGFRPSAHYIRAMQEYGILRKSLDPRSADVDPYATDRAYWRSFWWRPPSTGSYQ